MDLKPLDPFTPEEFAAEMREIATKMDAESGHIAADQLMCEQLHRLGYEEGVDIFVKMGKWYA